MNLKKHKSTLLGLLALIAIRSSFADHYLVPSGSMEPSLRPGDHILVNKMAYDLRAPLTDLTLVKISEPRRGDVVVFKYPVDPSILFVKRLIGVPGDKIQVVDGVVRVNGAVLQTSAGDLDEIERSLRETRNTFVYRERIDGREHDVQRIPEMLRSLNQEFTVPPGHYFFMGDNRDNSADSRFWGFVPRDHIKGRALARMGGFNPQLLL